MIGEVDYGWWRSGAGEVQKGDVASPRGGFSLIGRWRALKSLVFKQVGREARKRAVRQRQCEEE